MKTRIYTTPKAGLENSQNEDAAAVDVVEPDALWIRVADGASTGVFSREWSRHLCRDFAFRPIRCEDDFEQRLDTLREAFQPEITRPSALRKFLTEGCYATLLTAWVRKTQEKTGGELQLTLFAIGDVCLFRFDPAGALQFAFPHNQAKNFNNVPHLIRSKAALQAKTPYQIAQAEISAYPDDLIAIATDALSEYLFETIANGKHRSDLLKILECEDNRAFKDVIDRFRANGMKNDDVTVCFLTGHPDLYFV